MRRIKSSKEVPKIKNTALKRPGIQSKVEQSISSRRETQSIQKQQIKSSHSSHSEQIQGDTSVSGKKEYLQNREEGIQSRHRKEEQEELFLMKEEEKKREYEQKKREEDKRQEEQREREKKAAEEKRRQSKRQEERMERISSDSSGLSPREKQKKEAKRRFAEKLQEQKEQKSYQEKKALQQETRDSLYRIEEERRKEEFSSYIPPAPTPSSVSEKVRLRDFEQKQRAETIERNYFRDMKARQQIHGIRNHESKYVRNTADPLKTSRFDTRKVRSVYMSDRTKMQLKKQSALVSIQRLYLKKRNEKELQKRKEIHSKKVRENDRALLAFREMKEREKIVDLSSYQEDIRTAKDFGRELDEKVSGKNLRFLPKIRSMKVKDGPGFRARYLSGGKKAKIGKSSATEEMLYKSKGGIIGKEELRKESTGLLVKIHHLSKHNKESLRFLSKDNQVKKITQKAAEKTKERIRRELREGDRSENTGTKTILATHDLFNATRNIKRRINNMRSAGQQLHKTGQTRMQQRLLTARKQSLLQRMRAGKISAGEQKISAVAMSLKEKAVATVKHVAAGVAKSKGLVVAVIAILLIALFGGAGSGGESGTYLTQYVIMAETETIESYVQTFNDLENEFQKTIDDLRADAAQSYDSVRVDIKTEDGTAVVNFLEILAALAVEKEQNLINDPSEHEFIRKMYAMMKTYKTKTETYVAGYDSENRPIYQTRFIVEIYVKSYSEIKDELGFTEEQDEWVMRLLSGDMLEGHDLSITVPGHSDIKPLSQAEIDALMQGLPAISGAREKVIAAAFKYLNAGIIYSMERRGQGNYMDCSYYTMTVFREVFGVNIGSTTALQFPNSYPIDYSSLKPGDLAFQAVPGTTLYNHVGIFVKMENGKPMFIHCNASAGTVSYDHAYGVFKYFRRPKNVNYGD